MNSTARNAIFRTLAQRNPHPVSELNYSSPFELLAAVMLSAQSTDKGVNAATAKLFQVANTPQAIADLGAAGLVPYIRSLGFFRMKAQHLAATASILCEKYGGKVPSNFEELIELPGVGKKTAKVVLNVAFGKPYIAVDTHIFRVAHRTGLADGKTPDEVSRQLEASVPKKYLANAHHWLLLHGRYCCKARKPLCGQCPIAQWCEYPDKIFDKTTVKHSPY